MQEAKRTLREARFKQKQVKQNRKYYQNFGKGGRNGTPGYSRPRDDSNIECLGCGQRGYRVANCPNKASATAASAEPARGTTDGDRQQAPFVCFLEKAATSDQDSDETEGFVGYVQEAYASEDPAPTASKLTTPEAVRLGMCVIDGGATQTISAAWQRSRPS